MSKKPSDATLLKRERALSRNLGKLLGETRNERDDYRARATRAEQEVADWKRRFDALLARDPRSLEGVSGSAQ